MKILAVNIMGTPTINNGVVSGYNTNNYITTSNSIPQINSFVQVIKFRTTSLSALQCLVAGHSFKGLGTIQITTAGEFKTYFSSNGTSNNVSNGTTSSACISTNTDYWMKYEWNGAKYTIDISTNGETYTTVLTITNSSAPSFDGYIGFGVDTGNSNNIPLVGEIDLNESYININGTRWWSGIVETQIKRLKVCTNTAQKSIKAQRNTNIDKIPMVDIYGNDSLSNSPQIINGVISNFGTGNFAQTYNLFAPSSNTWEMVYKIKTGNDITTQQYVFCGTNANYGCGDIYIKNAKSYLSLSSNSTSGNIASEVVGAYTYLANTNYWIKLTFNGSRYELSCSIDGQTYTTDKTVNSSTAVWQGSRIAFGIDRYSGASQYPFKGEIDLNESYININNQRWWTGVSIYILQGIKVVGEK